MIGSCVQVIIRGVDFKGSAFVGRSLLVHMSYVNICGS